MNQREAKRWVAELTVRSLRRMVDRVRVADLGRNSATQKDVTKVKTELKRLAIQMEKKLGGAVLQTSDGYLEGGLVDAAQAGAPGPDKGEDGLPKDGDPPVAGQAPAPAGVDKPKARRRKATH